MCTCSTFEKQVSSIIETIEYNILTSVRRVANTVVIIAEDFCCVCVLMICIALYIKVTIQTDGQVISYRYVCFDICVKINLYLVEKRVHLLYNTGTFILTAKHEQRVNPFVTIVGKGCPSFAILSQVAGRKPLFTVRCGRGRQFFVPDFKFGHTQTI